MAEQVSPRHQGLARYPTTRTGMDSQGVINPLSPVSLIGTGSLEWFCGQDDRESLAWQAKAGPLNWATSFWRAGLVQPSLRPLGILIGSRTAPIFGQHWGPLVSPSGARAARGSTAITHRPIAAPMAPSRPRIVGASMAGFCQA